jgi:hypothetical protein
MVRMVPALNLYSLNPYVPPISTRNSGLADASTFNIEISNPSTGTDVNYAVNDPSAADTQSAGTYYTIESTDGRLSSNAATAARNYAQALWLTQSPDLSGASVATTTLKSVDQIPSTIDAYNQWLASLSLNADQFDALRISGDFSIANGRMATMVETDAMGNITNTRLGQNRQSVTPGLFATADDFTYANRQAILAGAFKRVDVAPPTVADRIQQTLNTLQKPKNDLDGGLNDLPDVFKQQIRTIQKFAQNGVDFGLTPDRLGLKDSRIASPAQELLAQLQTSNKSSLNQGPTALGSLDNTSSQKVATVQANWQLQLSDDTQRNLRALKQAQLDQGSVYKPMPMDRLMDGLIPTLPHGLPNKPTERAFLAELPQPPGSDAELELAGLESASDATSRKSAGGYIPFAMGGGQADVGGSMAFGGGFSSGSGSNPFAGMMGGSSGFSSGGNLAGSNSQPQAPAHKRLSLTA